MAVPLPARRNLLAGATLLVTVAAMLAEVFVGRLVKSDHNTAVLPLAVWMWNQLQLHHQLPPSAPQLFGDSHIFADGDQGLAPPIVVAARYGWDEVGGRYEPVYGRALGRASGRVHPRAGG